VTGRTTVALFIWRESDSGTLVVVCEIECFGPCVSYTKKRAGPATSKLCLQTVIRRVSIWLDAHNICIYPKPDKWATSIRGSRSTWVYVDESHLTYCTRTNVTNLSYELGRQLPFNEKVERVNSVPLHLFRERC